MLELTSPVAAALCLMLCLLVACCGCRFTRSLVFAAAAFVASVSFVAAAMATPPPGTEPAGIVMSYEVGFEVDAVGPESADLHGYVEGCLYATWDQDARQMATRLMRQAIPRARVTGVTLQRGCPQVER